MNKFIRKQIERFHDATWGMQRRLAYKLFAEHFNVTYDAGYEDGAHDERHGTDTYQDLRAR